MSMSNTEKTLKNIRRNTRRKFSTEGRIHIVLVCGVSHYGTK